MKLLKPGGLACLHLLCENIVPDIFPSLDTKEFTVIRMVHTVTFTFVVYVFRNQLSIAIKRCQSNDTISEKWGCLHGINTQFPVNENTMLKPERVKVDLASFKKVLPQQFPDNILKVRSNIHPALGRHNYGMIYASVLFQWIDDIDLFAVHSL